MVSNGANNLRKNETDGERMSIATSRQVDWKAFTKCHLASYHKHKLLCGASGKSTHNQEVNLSGCSHHFSWCGFDVHQLTAHSCWPTERF